MLAINVQPSTDFNQNKEQEEKMSVTFYIFFNQTNVIDQFLGPVTKIWFLQLNTMPFNLSRNRISEPISHFAATCNEFQISVLTFKNRK